MSRNSLLVSSNLGWLLPAYIALAGGSWWWVPAVLVGGVSATFHLTKSIKVEWVDTRLATLYILTGPYLLWQAEASWLTWLTCVTLATVAGTLLYFGRNELKKSGESEKYIFIHSSWHVMASVVATVIYLIYFGFINLV